MDPLSDREALAGIALLAMKADGVMRGEEDEMIRERLEDYAMFGEAGESDLALVLHRLEVASREEGPDRLLEACCAALPESLAEMAKQIARDVMAVDSEDAPDEEAFMERLDSLLAHST